MNEYTPEQIVGYIKDFSAAFEGLQRVAERIPKYNGGIANYTSEIQNAVKIKVTKFLRLNCSKECLMSCTKIGA